MPKSSPSSPSHKLTQPKQSLDDSTSRMSDTALRKIKNAQAQAAFRARRANYIATLEETVTSLESVVLQLQESCRESKNECQELRHQNVRLTYEYREREKFWKTMWQARKSGQQMDADEQFPLPPPFSPPQANIIKPHLGNINIQHYGGETLGYRSSEDAFCHAGYSTSGLSNHSFQNHSPAMSFTAAGATESDIPADGAIPHRLPKYEAYTYSMGNASRETRWQGQPSIQSLPSAGDCGIVTNTQPSHSPTYEESPTSTSGDMPYVGRFSAEEQKLSALDSAPYVFPNGERFVTNERNRRSMSPTASTAGSSSSTSMAASTYPFTFPNHAMSTATNTLEQDRADFDYHRHSNPHGGDVTLHGGTADITVTASADAVRYRVGGRRLESDRPLLPALAPILPGDNSLKHERTTSDGDNASYSHPRLRTRRATTVSRESRTPSPGTPPISCTVAVIKAQAFGALRRTRTRTKKSSEGANKVVMDVLEARGIGMNLSPGIKRARLDEDK